MYCACRLLQIYPLSTPVHHNMEKMMDSTVSSSLFSDDYITSWLHDLTISTNQPHNNDTTTMTVTEETNPIYMDILNFGFVTLVFFAVCQGLVMIAICLGNMLVVIGIGRAPQLWTINNFFIVQLAIADLIVGGTCVFHIVVLFMDYLLNNIYVCLLRYGFMILGQVS